MPTSGGSSKRTADESYLATTPGDAVEFLRSVLAAVPAFITRIDGKDRITYINHVQPGLAFDRVLGTDVFEFIAPEHHACARATFDRVRSTGRSDRYEAVAAGPDGSRAFYENFVSLVREADGSAGLCIVGVDLTEQKRREDALGESEAKVRLAVDATGIGLWSLDFATNDVVWDQRMCEISGVETPLDIESYRDQLVHPDDRQLMDADVERLMSEGSFRSTYRIVRPDGAERWLLAAGRLVRDAGGEPARLLGSVIDITEKRAIEQQLRQAQKMQAVGNLTAGIAHNFNNMLMVILPSLDLLSRVTPESHAPIVEDAQMAARRAADMVRELMLYAGQSRSTHRSHCAIAQLLSQAVQIARRTFDRHIEISVNCASPHTALCSPGEVEQVVMNLLLNARDALQAAGTEKPHIEIAVTEVEARNPEGLRFGRYHCVRIADNGPGMPLEVATQVFEPFFTTKGGHGTGLGLATSYAIIRDHEGWMECESALNSGTVMRIFLPASDDRGAQARKSTANERPVTPTGSRVLLIDDEEALRRVVTLALADAGHEVVNAADADQAIALLEDDPDFDIVLLDRSMPGAPGRCLVPELRRHVPAARIYFFTGAPSPDDAALVDGTLCKPVDIDELISLVAAARRG